MRPTLNVIKVAKKVKSLMNCIAGVEELLLQGEVSDVLSLQALPQTNFDALCIRAGRAYEYAISHEISIRDKDKIRTARAGILHITDNLTGTDAAAGFDDVSLQEYWDSHFGPDGIIWKIKSGLEKFVASNSALVAEVEKLKSIPDSVAGIAPENASVQPEVLDNYLQNIASQDRIFRLKALGYIEWYGEIRKGDLVKILCNGQPELEAVVIANLKVLCSTEIVTETDNFYLSNKGTAEFRAIYEEAAEAIIDEIVEREGLSGGV